MEMWFYVCGFVFFKQKTAYEMRISDWSSDVCSSDLIESLAYETQRLGLQGRVTGSHLTSMHSMDNYYATKLMALMREAQVHAVANPLINITLQGRHDTYPKRRGMTRVKELLLQGINVAFGHDRSEEHTSELQSLMR